jgi:Fe-S oxidoreductase
MEEQNKDRVNVRRTLQLLQPDPATIATACPFCMTMITDGLKDKEKEDKVRQMDIAELLEESCLERKTKAKTEPRASASGPAAEA